MILATAIRKVERRRVVGVRILYIDIDTLRPDHLGCYGYPRNTSPNIDLIASEGIRFTNCYASDVPCLPSRTAFFSTGRFGIHTGVVGHGGTAADLILQGESRGFGVSEDRISLAMALRKLGFYTVSVSPFAERHAAWHFYQGFNEMHNTGKRGGERADEVAPIALEWIKNNGRKDNWFLHVNMWDPHTPYRTPLEYGNPFEKDPPPSWLTEEVIRQQYNSYGPMGAHEVRGWGSRQLLPREVPEITSIQDFKRCIDGYDTGIRYADEYVGKILQALDEQGVLDETIIIVSSDHGENLGELNVYGDHQTADYITCRVPLIIRWPGLTKGGVDSALHYQLDLAPTLIELLGGTAPTLWDGRSFASSLRTGEENGRDYLVVSQCAWSCQRGVRFGPWILIRTYHDGLKDFPPLMLFNVEEDPHETQNLAGERPDIVNQGLAYLELWHGDMMASSEIQQDPMWTVIREGGPYHVRGDFLAEYCKRLRETGRGHHADKLERQYGGTR